MWNEWCLIENGQGLDGQRMGEVTSDLMSL